MWIYSLPLAALGLFVVGTCVLLTWVAVFLMRRHGWTLSHDDHLEAAVLHQIVGVLYAVTLGLIVVSIQEDYSEVERAAVAEASAVGDLHRHADGLQEPAGSRIKANVRRYVDSVLDEEWPAIRRGGRSDSTEAIVDRLARDISTLAPANRHDELLLPELLDSTQTILDRRRERIFLGQQGVSRALWAVIILGGAVTIGFACGFKFDDHLKHYLATGALATMFGLMVFLVVALDHPLWGSLSVRPEAFETIRASLAQGPQRP
jgi:hypothetical protein